MDIHFSLQSPDTVQAKNSIIKKSCVYLPHLRSIHKKNVIFNLISACYGSINWCSHTVDIRSSDVALALVDSIMNIAIDMLQTCQRLFQRNNAITVN